jgi:glutamine amidotransferase
MNRIAVIDYGMGNLRSVSKAIEHVAPDDEIIVTGDSETIRAADKIVCPGQGAAADCMRALRENGLTEIIGDVIGSRPFLGICMGFQVLFDNSEENEGVSCLGHLPGQVRRFSEPLLDADGHRLKVPHMGWSQVAHSRAHPLWQGIANQSRFYFAHSYFCVPADVTLATGVCNYGQDIVVSVASDKVFACQFHPEKSADDGLQLLRNFVHWNGEQ